MRLINTSTLQFEEFYEPNLPDYVIVSHTWASEEVNHQEFLCASQDAFIQNRAGYHKIKWSCRVAKESGHAYLWIDTCCIDKTSAVELSEAINSMFRWYRGSAICYAYLADVNESDMQQNPKDALKRCRWVSRGWCLQELIAPANIMFYDKQWKPIGTKQQFAEELSQATNVDVQVLHDSSCLNAIMVARRMSWAANRETARLEDMAYCLMGIFDVNMPMLYGEGSKAFSRLQQQIFGATHDLSIFAWFPNDSCDVRYLPMFAPSPKHFASCADIELSDEIDLRLGSTIVGQAQFTMTQQHILARSLALRIYEFPNFRCYGFSTNVSPGTTGNNMPIIFLKKVGPGLFVRFRPQSVDSKPIHWWPSGDDLVDIYQAPDPGLFGKFDACHAWAVRIGSISAPEGLRLSFDTPEPETRFDNSYLMFLSQGLLRFRCYLSIKLVSVSQPLERFIVACAIWRTGYEKRPNQVCAEHDDVVVQIKLIDAENWDNLPLGRRTYWRVTDALNYSEAGSFWNAGCRRQELTLTQHRVTATVIPTSFDGYPIFKLNFDIKALKYNGSRSSQASTVE